MNVKTYNDNCFSYSLTVILKINDFYEIKLRSVYKG